MDTIIFTKIGVVMVFLFAGMGITAFTFKVWKLFVDFIFEYKQFKQWKKDLKGHKIKHL